MRVYKLVIVVNHDEEVHAGIKLRPITATTTTAMADKLPCPYIHIHIHIHNYSLKIETIIK